MNSPFSCNNSRYESLKMINSIRANREDEIRTCFENITSSNSNILIYGERGIGKTFVIRLLEKKLQERCDNVFSFRVNVMEILSYDRIDPISAFPASVLIHLCHSIWKDLFKNSHLDLMDPLFNPKKHIKLKNKDEQLIQDIYYRIRSQQRKLIYQAQNKAGLTAIAKAEMNETYTEEVNPISLLPFEFFKFIEVIQDEILAPRGINKLIVLCDEMNILPIITQKELIERYIELFSERSLQFIFVAGSIKGQRIYGVPDCFDVTIELSEFDNIAHIDELIAKRMSGTNLKIDHGAAEIILKTSGGNPRTILWVCETATRKVLNRDEETINIDDIRNAAQEVMRHIKQLMANMDGGEKLENGVMCHPEIM